MIKRAKGKLKNLVFDNLQIIFICNDKKFKNIQKELKDLLELENDKELSIVGNSLFVKKTEIWNFNYYNSIKQAKDKKNKLFLYLIKEVKIGKKKTVINKMLSIDTKYIMKIANAFY